MTRQKISLSARKGLWPTLTALTAIAALAAALVGLDARKAEASSAPAQAPAVPVSVAAVQAESVRTWDEFSGRLEAVQRVEVRPRVAGAVLSVHFQEGALVRQGDLLVTIDPAPYAAEVERAEAQVAAARARQGYARSEQARASRLWDERAIAQRDLDERSNALREADANLRAAQAALNSARLNLDYTQVRAPVAGRIGRLEVTVGNLVGAGAAAPVLANLVSVSPIYASFDVDERAVGKALRELPQTLDRRAAIGRIPVQMGTVASDGTPFEGHLQLIDNQVDARSGTVRVRAAFENKDGVLIPGQFARIRMGQASNSDLLLVSERAIGTDQDKKFVLVIGAGDKAEYREVKVGASVRGLRVVQSGLAPGERVVVNGLQHVRPGMQVAPQLVAMDALAAGAATGAARVASN
ncbi:efflux RND transporter periplasmic adaptor subunit [Variovorax sp.]|uniref:efflux RND transporter periplasmic adaptor subunit n=1 Tax=Variovorax sp. TaxID=1871043 RepID=UPI002D3B897D|nr:efflux RND transporter periplasmic adaptor subunit [Variovorax sp.]HYP82158.1 efflux RND transporter periplasmic adaptor subunit [Variovorax sp.]